MGRGGKESEMDTEIIDIAPFCAGGNDHRVLLYEPFKRGCYLYATDGNIAVRILAAGVGKDTVGAPNMEDTFHQLHAEVHQWLPMLWENSTCSECGAKINCDMCGGSGKSIVKDPPPVEICGGFLPVAKLRKILCLPNPVEYGIVPGLLEKRQAIMPFRFNGGIGLVVLSKTMHDAQKCR
jgi:hypothetical protein